MSFAQNLEKCFHILTQGQIYTEEELCIKLEDALLLCNKFSLVNREIVILHNPDRKRVSFSLAREWNTEFPAGTQKHCFLADMLYVIYSPSQESCRIFLMKNRRKKATEFVNRFYTGLAQLDLLSSQSTFTLEGSQRCETLLRDAEVRSIADYGVFYKTKQGYDMRIYSADLITPLQEVGVEPRRVVVFRGGVNQRRVSGQNWVEDYEGFSTLRHFGKAVEDMMIGQPVSGKWKEGLLKNLKGMDDLEIPVDFCNCNVKSESGENLDPEGFDFLKSIGSIVLINVDEE